jgi:hypothetical protein
MIDHRHQHGSEIKNTERGKDRKIDERHDKYSVAGRWQLRKVASKLTKKEVTRKGRNEQTRICSVSLIFGSVSGIAAEWCILL